MPQSFAHSVLLWGIFYLYDKMAKIIRENLDMDRIYRILERKDMRG